MGRTKFRPVKVVLTSGRAKKKEILNVSFQELKNPGNLIHPLMII